MRKYLIRFLFVTAVAGIGFLSYSTYSPEINNILNPKKEICFKTSIAMIKLLDTIKAYDQTIQSSSNIGDKRFKWGELQLAFATLHEEFQSLHLKNRSVDYITEPSIELIKAFQMEAQVHMEIANFFVAQTPPYSNMAEGDKARLMSLLNRQTTIAAQLKVSREFFTLLMNVDLWTCLFRELDDTKGLEVYNFLLSKFQSVINDYQSKKLKNNEVLMPPIECYAINMYYYLQNNHINISNKERGNNGR